ncbi:MAG: hypothetical protein J6Q56_02425 [Clostridia bacterium]|nr:hypothetical protein [Clostridia bacterium]
MLTCSFFGHSSCPNSIQPELKKQIELLINDHNVKKFLLGDHGDFDVMVLKAIRELSQIYQIDYQVVLSYRPQSYNFFAKDPKSIYPEELAFVHKKYAINYRNNYLIDKSDFFITYITHSYGGAAKFANKAKNRGKTVINIADKFSH